MKSLKILLLSSIFLFTNCSLINDKIFSRSEKNKKNEFEEQELAKDSSKKSKEEEMIFERVYIEDDKEKEVAQTQDGLYGDTEFQNNTDYPNLAEVPERPDPSISLEEQNSIIKDLENNSQLEPAPFEPIIEDKISNLDPGFNDIGDGKSKKKYNSTKSYKDTKNSIRNIQISKLEEIETFRPDVTQLLMMQNKSYIV